MTTKPRADAAGHARYSNELVRQMREYSTGGLKPGSLDGGLLGIGGTIAANRDVRR